MKKNYIVLASVWLASIVLMGAVIAFIQNSGIMAKFMPQKALAQTACTVTSDATVTGKLTVNGSFYMLGNRSACGTCGATNDMEAVVCDVGGACSGWGLELCYSGTWQCWEDF